MTNKPSSHIPLKKALLWIILSLILVSGATGSALVYYQSLYEQKKEDSKYQIIAIVQSCSEGEMLKTVYLAELLGLSIDKPMNLYNFNNTEATKKLLDCPLIKNANVKKVSPGTLYIHYTLRKPIAFLADFTNTVVDMDGIPFPFKPFYTPKKLPEIVLGFSEISWGDPLQGKPIELAFSVLDFIEKHVLDTTSRLSRIDVSQAFASSCGQCQIIVVIEDRITKEVAGHSKLCLSPRILRLSPASFKEQLGYYIVLQNHLRTKDVQEKSWAEGDIFKIKPTIIDLRIPKLAFITPRE